MAIQRYDVRDPSGHFVECYWRPLNTPLFDQGGHPILLLHQVEGATDEALHSQDDKPNRTGQSALVQVRSDAQSALGPAHAQVRLSLLAAQFKRVMICEASVAAFATPVFLTKA